MPGKIVYLLTILLTIFISSLTYAEDKKPVITIRFSQEDVVYRPILKQIVEMAKDAKSSVKFNIVSTVPTTGNDAKNNASHDYAKTRAIDIADYIKNFGINKNNITINYKNDWNIDFNEVNIFVQ